MTAPCTGSGREPQWTHTITGGPWPERVGKRCRVVERPGPPAGDVYPWPGLGRNEVVVLVEDDPFDAPREVRGIEFGRDDTDAERGWSCVIGVSDITAAPHA